MITMKLCRYKVMIVIKFLQISVLNNPWGVDMPLNKWNQNRYTNLLDNELLKLITGN